MAEGREAPAEPKFSTWQDVVGKRAGSNGAQTSAGTPTRGTGDTTAVPDRRFYRCSTLTCMEMGAPQPANGSSMPTIPNFLCAGSADCVTLVEL